MVYNKTSATTSRGVTVPSVYNKTRGSALASEQHRAGTPHDSRAATAVYNKTSRPECLIHHDHDHGNGLLFCITNPTAGSGRSMGPVPARLARVLLTELA
jgi:hypothetical protein